MNEHNEFMIKSMDDTTAAKWWSSRRLRYNRGLFISGFLTFIVYIVLGSTFLSESDFEVTIITMLVQGFAFLVMVIIANIFYSLGHASERILRPNNPDRYRKICYQMGYGFSVSLIFFVPVFLMISAILFQDTE